MEFILRQVHKAGVFGWLYVLNLFFGLHVFTVHFIDSSYLATFIGKENVGLLFTGAFFLSLIVLASITYFLQAYGAYLTILGAATLDIIAMCGLATGTQPGLIVVYFALHTFLVPCILFCLDVLFEQDNKDKENTGNARGTYLTIATGTSLVSPLLAGLLIGSTSNYQPVYLTSAMFLIPFLLIFIYRYRTFVDPVYRTFEFRRIIATLSAHHNTRRVAVGQFLMRFYFAWMTIYLPLYLHETIGFTWAEVGTILFIMLIPYILVEWPAGIIADKWLGEKELLLIGFALTAIPTALLVLLDSTDLYVWAGILFVSRIGTALIESMTETYFFKKIHKEDTDTMTFFRLLRPLAYTLAPLAATFVLLYTDMQHLWLVLSLIMLIGVWQTLGLKDTK